MDNLARYYKKAIKIYTDPSMTEDQKDVRLAELMTSMERVYKIPMLRNEQWNKDNPYIICIYHEISNMRSI